MPTGNIFLQLKIGVLDAEFVRFQLDPNNPATDYSGNRTASSPKFSLAAVARYSMPIGANSLTGQSDFSYTGGVFYTADNSPVLYQPGYWIMNGRITFAPPNGRYNVAAWVKNIMDKGYYAAGLASTALGFYAVTPGLPRTFGVTVARRF